MRCYEHLNILSRDKSIKKKRKMEEETNERKMENFLKKIIESDNNK